MIRRTSRSLLMSLAGIAPLAVAPFAAGEARAADCELKCSDIPRMERELAQQQIARDAFREFTYDAVGPGGRRNVPTIKALQVAHAALFSQMASGGGRGGGRGGRIVARPALETDLNDCKVLEVLKDGKRVALDEEAYRKKVCPFGDFLIEHEQHHVRKCKRFHDAGRSHEFLDPLVIAEMEYEGYQFGIGFLAGQIAALKGGCGLVPSGGVPNPGLGLGRAAIDGPALGRSSSRAASALKKGWKR